MISEIATCNKIHQGQRWKYRRWCRKNFNRRRVGRGSGESSKIPKISALNFRKSYPHLKVKISSWFEPRDRLSRISCYIPSRPGWSEAPSANQELQCSTFRRKIPNMQIPRYGFSVPIPKVDNFLFNIIFTVFTTVNSVPLVVSPRIKKITKKALHTIISLRWYKNWSSYFLAGKVIDWDLDSVSHISMIRTGSGIYPEGIKPGKILDFSSWEKLKS